MKEKLLYKTIIDYQTVSMVGFASMSDKKPIEIWVDQRVEQLIAMVKDILKRNLTSEEMVSIKTSYQDAAVQSCYQTIITMEFYKQDYERIMEATEPKTKIRL